MTDNIKHIHISKVGGTHCLECGQQLPQSTIDEQGASEKPQLGEQPSVSKSLTVEEAYRRGVIDATGGLAIPNLMNHQKSRNTAFKKYAIKFFNTKIKERRERLLGNAVNDLATSNLTCNSGVSNPQQIAQEANKATAGIVKALTYKGSHPAYHDEQLRYLETHWPTLYFELKKLITADKEQA